MEVRLGRYRVDAVVEDRLGKELIEIQLGSLWAIRDRICRLTRRHRVRIVKPIIGRKRLFKRDRKGGRVVDQRFSPRQGRMLELFDELVYFTRAFPHRNLTLEVLLVDIEEWRYPSRNRRRPWRKQFAVEDQKLIAICETKRFATANDLRQLVNCTLPQTFDTAQLAAGLNVPRWMAQRIAYVLRTMGSVQTIGKRRGARLYQWKDITKTRKAA